MMSDRDDPSIISEALPDLVIGLIGIPVAFALQNIAEKLGTRGELISMEALRLTVFLVSLYAGYAIVVFFTLQASLKDPRLRPQWQEHLIRLVIPLALTAIFFVGSVIGFGQAFEKGQLDVCFCMACLCGLSIIGASFPLICHQCILDFLWNRYRTIVTFFAGSSAVPMGILVWEILQLYSQLK